jgi:hypothetical protein
MEVTPDENEHTASSGEAERPAPTPALEAQYRQAFTRMKMTSLDLNIRRDILRDIYRELNDHPGEQTTEELLDMLEERYEAAGLIRIKSMLRETLQLAFRQGVFDYYDQPVSPYAPVKLAPGIDSEAGFVGRAEADFVYALVRSGMETIC